MNITTIGRGNVGGGLAHRWEKAGHTVTQLGRDGGDASDADVVLVAVPSGAIALDRARALEEHLLGVYSALLGFFYRYAKPGEL
jgi:prephenate dehydrogenase